MRVGFRLMEINKIYNEDCLRGMKTRLKSNSIDIIITSPPYNIGIKYNSYKDNKKFEEYLEWMNKFAQESCRVLKENGSFFFNIGDKPSDDLRSFNVANRILKYFKLQNSIHWIKSLAAPDRYVNIGHYKPINGKRYLSNCHEYIFHFTKKGDVNINKLAIGVPYGDKSNIGRYSKQDIRDRGNTWFIPYETVQEEKTHPAAFPTRLPEMCIKLHGFNKNTVVLDPFMGSGSTAIAARNLGHNFIGFEIDRKYIKICKEQLSQRKLL